MLLNWKKLGPCFSGYFMLVDDVDILSQLGKGVSRWPQWQAVTLEIFSRAGPSLLLAGRKGLVLWVRVLNTLCALEAVKHLGVFL